MKFTMQREALLQPLTQVAGVVERRQTLPILANIKIQAEAGTLICTATDMEIELSARHECNVETPGQVTAPARKLVDICRALPDGSQIVFSVQDNQVHIHTEHSHFSLSALPADEFPEMDYSEDFHRFTLPRNQLRGLLDQTSFAMANQDVRYFLNGLLLELRDTGLRAVATDGHRMAMSDLNGVGSMPDDGKTTQVIAPRKGILELQRLLQDDDTPINLGIGSNHFQVDMPGLVMTSKLIDGRFPDYAAVVPPANDLSVLIDRAQLRASLQRVAILSNEKFRGVRLEFTNGNIKIIAHNPQQEEAVEEIAADHSIDGLSIGFNVNYLLDALSALTTERAQIKLRDANSSCLITEPDSDQSCHVVMPLKL